MLRKEFLESLTPKHRSTGKYTLPNYYQLKAFKKLGSYYNVEQEAYSLGCDTNHFYYSNNTEAFISELFEKTKPFFYKPKGLGGFVRMNQEYLEEFLKPPGSLKKFLTRLEKVETAVMMENILTEVLERELEEKNFFKEDPGKILKLINPSSTLATEEKLKAKKEMNFLNDYELGKKYGWLQAKEFLRKDERETGAMIRKMLKELNEEQIINNIEKNKEFIEEANVSEELMIFSENARMLNYLSCSAHKYIIIGRKRVRPFLDYFSEELGIASEETLYCLPWELEEKKIDKKKIEERKKLSHVIMLNEKEDLLEF